MSFKLASIAMNVGVNRKGSKMQFVLSGFKQDVGFRVFNFESTNAAGAKLQFAVKADLALARKYGIQMQALPLLCWGLLEHNQNESERTFTYGEDEMCLYARACKEERAAVLLKKQSARRALNTTQPGVGWRTAAPQTTHS